MKRTANLLGFLIVVAIFLFVLYTQYVEHYQPCPLCLLQRAFLLLLGVGFLAAALVRGGRWTSRFWALILFVFAALGLTVALRQIWLQYFAPPQLASCGAHLDWMLRHLPFTETLELGLRGSGIHEADERVGVDELEELRALYGAVIERFFTAAGTG